MDSALSLGCMIPPLIHPCISRWLPPPATAHSHVLRLTFLGFLVLTAEANTQTTQSYATSNAFYRDLTLTLHPPRSR